MAEHLSGEAFKSREEAEKALLMPPASYVIDEGQRQAILMALGVLVAHRPGWDEMLGGIAEIFEGREMYEQFKASGPA